MTVTASTFCQLTAHQAVSNGAVASVDELWALAEMVDAMKARMLVDVGGGLAMRRAWWSMVTTVVGVDPAPAVLTGADEGPVTVLHGHPGDRVTVSRLTDQVARSRVDVMALHPQPDDPAAEVQRLVASYERLVRPGGLLAVFGIARHSGVRAWWESSRNAYKQRSELVAVVEPIGVAVIHTPGEGASHG